MVVIPFCGLPGYPMQLFDSKPKPIPLNQPLLLVIEGQMLSDPLVSTSTNACKADVKIIGIRESVSFTLA